MKKAKYGKIKLLTIKHFLLYTQMFTALKPERAKPKTTSGNNHTAHQARIETLYKCTIHKKAQITGEHTKREYSTA